MAAGEEAWELRLVMKSENVRENMGFSGQVWEFQNLYYTEKG